MEKWIRPSLPPPIFASLSLSFAFYFSVVLRCSIIIAEEERNVFDASSSSSSFLPASSELLRGEIHPPCDQSRNCRRRHRRHRSLSRCQSEESTIMTNSRSVAFAKSHMNDQTPEVRTRLREFKALIRSMERPPPPQLLRRPNLDGNSDICE